VLRAAKDGVLLSVRVTPKAKQPGLEKIADRGDGPRLRLRVRSAPEDGKANAEAAALVAAALQFAKAQVSVVSGMKNRDKTILVSGNPALLLPRLNAWIEGLGS
jgi:uncharacterized protein (TIGR00251 family)